MNSYVVTVMMSLTTHSLNTHTGEAAFTESAGCQGGGVDKEAQGDGTPPQAGLSHAVQVERERCSVMCAHQLHCMY